MMNIEPDASHTPDVLRDILEEIEVLRMKRQEEGRDRPHPFHKRFTQQELTDEACPTYKNLLVGRSQRIPSRQTLMQIADYLECSMESRNNLLLAARYLPESLELEGDALRLTLEQARQLMETLPYPAMLVTHRLSIEALNEPFQRFFAFPPLMALPRTQRYVLPVFFREDLPIRQRSSFNDQAVKAWQAGVSRGIELFKQSNRLYQFEPWYHELVKQFCAVADFRRYWERTPSLFDQHDAPSKLLLGRNATTEEWLPIELQHIRISVCSHMYPCIMALRPLDDAARSVFASLSSAQGSPFNAVGRR
ncbi:hypothetical protein KSF_004320 [Reticulibacter mediterranei]|uniref:MmyB-like transcription regulator ligand binding domain-containing protein n=1 Tax=Reticulibacter mediterranei TaxID=2778369 RepID=A0A8J3MWZ2_9CHLR|nr:hypothetical protein [Reticulibacter mediterranei]GHO90384.1 hypothetical protein KSF_004320 [Reticulibacter mediterranei]